MKNILIIICAVLLISTAQASIPDEDFVKYKAMFTDREMVIGYDGGVYNYDQFCDMYYAGHPDERMRTGYWVEVGRSTTSSISPTESLDSWHDGYDRVEVDHVPGQSNWYVYKPEKHAKDSGWKPDVPGYRPVPVYPRRPGSGPVWYVYYPTNNPDAVE